MIREAIEKVNEVKMPQIMVDLEEWLRFIYPELEVKHLPKWKMFKGAKHTGQTEFIFKSVRDAKDVAKKIQNAQKFEKLSINWGGWVLGVPWFEAAEPVDKMNWD